MLSALELAAEGLPPLEKHPCVYILATMGAALVEGKNGFSRGFIDP